MEIMDDKTQKHKEDMKNSIGRLIFVGVAALLQLIWFYFIILRLSEHYLPVSLAMQVLTVLSVLLIFGRHTNANIKMSWIVAIFAMPVLGLMLFLLSDRSNFSKTMCRRFGVIEKELLPYKTDGSALIQELKVSDPGAANQMYFLQHRAGFRPYRNTDIQYFPEAMAAFQAQLADLRNAKDFIFMEYHAIEDREAFLELREVLKDRVLHGVEVRIFYDDIGSIGFINPRFIRSLEKDGIQCRVFNPIMPLVNLFMNNRDHRKITVIDGKIGYTGGYNLANEYFNLTSPYGYWKDTGIRMEGEAVRSLTMMFLEMWNAIQKSDQDYGKYLKEYVFQASPAIAQPFADTPLDDIHTGEDVYMNLLKNAKNYVYIMTPYLIITDELSRELRLCAERGVDVRIVTPGIPDKKLVYALTRSYYNPLVSSGIRIYEFTPGFTHGKMMVADDELAVIGTINLDYRSLYHHFENAVLLYKTPAILDMREDFLTCFGRSMEVTELYRSGRSGVKRVVQCIGRLFAPLM